MNTFLIGSRVEIHHYPDWSGSAFLAYEDMEYRIPGQVAKILVESLLKVEKESDPLEKKSLDCSACGKFAGTAWTTKGDDAIDHAICPDCHSDMDKASKLKSGGVIPAAVKAAFSPEDE
jgi:hypothetical protein